MRGEGGGVLGQKAQSELGVVADSNIKKHMRKKNKKLSTDHVLARVTLGRMQVAMTIPENPRRYSAWQVNGSKSKLRDDDVGRSRGPTRWQQMVALPSLNHREQRLIGGGEGRRWGIEWHPERRKHAVSSRDKPQSTFIWNWAGRTRSGWKKT